MAGSGPLSCRSAPFGRSQKSAHDVSTRNMTTEPKRSSNNAQHGMLRTFTADDANSEREANAVPLRAPEASPDGSLTGDSSLAKCEHLNRGKA